MDFAGAVSEIGASDSGPGAFLSQVAPVNASTDTASARMVQRVVFKAPRFLSVRLRLVKERGRCMERA